MLGKLQLPEIAIFFAVCRNSGLARWKKRKRRPDMAVNKIIKIAQRDRKNDRDILWVCLHVGLALGIALFINQ